MLSFPTNLLTCCQLREAMETPRECRGVSERTPEFGGCILIFIKWHPSARKVLYKGGYLFFLSFRRGGSFVGLCHTLCCFLSFFLPKKSSFSMCFTVIKYTCISLASCLNRHSGIISDKEQRDSNALKPSVAQAHTVPFTYSSTSVELRLDGHRTSFWR